MNAEQAKAINLWVETLKRAVLSLDLGFKPNFEIHLVFCIEGEKDIPTLGRHMLR